MHRSVEIIVFSTRLPTGRNTRKIRTLALLVPSYLLDTGKHGVTYINGVWNSALHQKGEPRTVMEYALGRSGPQKPMKVAGRFVSGHGFSRADQGP
jgi:hypothetical protein